MNGKIVFRLLITGVLAAIVTPTLSCGEAVDDVEPEFRPAHLSVDGTAGESSIVSLIVTNPGTQTHTFRFETTSERVEVETPQMTLDAGESEPLRARFNCPVETGTYEEQITMFDDQRGFEHTISAVLICHPSPDIGSGVITISIEGLPSGSRGKVELFGPGNTEFLLSESRDTPEVPPGHYTLSALPVEVDGHSFEPDPERVDFTLFDGDHLEFEIWYESETYFEAIAADDRD